MGRRHRSIDDPHEGPASIPSCPVDERRFHAQAPKLGRAAPCPRAPASPRASAASSDTPGPASLRCPRGCPYSILVASSSPSPFPGLRVRRERGTVLGDFEGDQTLIRWRAAQWLAAYSGVTWAPVPAQPGQLIPVALGHSFRNTWAPIPAHLGTRSAHLGAGLS